MSKYNNKLDIIDFAGKLAKRSNLKFYWHGCIIVCGNKVLSYGYNYVKNNKRIHAEVDAINKLNNVSKKLLNRCKLYVIRINNTHSLLNSKPCNNCECIIKHNKIKKVYYSF